MDPYPRGPDWMPITPKTGSLFHAETHQFCPKCILRSQETGRQGAEFRRAATAHPRLVIAV